MFLLNVVFQYGPQGLKELMAFDTADGLYDCAWCEVRELLRTGAEFIHDAAGHTL